MVNPRLFSRALLEICQRCRVECFMPSGIGMDRFDTLLSIINDVQKTLRQMFDCMTRVCNMPVSERGKLSLLVCGWDC